MAETMNVTHDVKDLGLAAQGKIKIEPKEDVIKRTGRSPDRADALLLAFYEAAAEATVLGHALPDANLMSSLTPGGWSAFGT